MIDPGLLNARAFYNVLRVEISLEVGNSGSSSLEGRCKGEDLSLGDSGGDHWHPDRAHGSVVDHTADNRALHGNTETQRTWSTWAQRSLGPESGANLAIERS